MDKCDALIVGGGPAGSTCAWKLRQGGLDAVVVDRARFPRDKVCGGWITPQVVASLQIDLAEYRRTRTLQAITGFRTGTIGGSRDLDTVYGRVVSYGIRRCEFDDYLLTRSGARLNCGTAVSTIRRDNGRWVLNERITAPMLVGAGGHFCPVARWLNDRGGQSADFPLVVAQEVESPIDPTLVDQFGISEDMPELYFCQDLKGYGWCFRKGGYINIGLGRADRHSLSRATGDFVAFLERRRKIPSAGAWQWRGHAYLLRGDPGRRVVGDGVVLIGDAAGLAYPASGEGIRPAVESGLLAAETILNANGRFTRPALAPYESRLRMRLGPGVRSHRVADLLPSGLWKPLAGRLLQTPAFVRHVALDRWFLHADLPPLAAAS